MKRIVLFLVLGALSAQLDAGWLKLYGGRGKSYGEWGYGVVQTSDEGYVAVGESNYGGTKIWLLRTDSMGDTLWSKAYDLEGTAICYCIKPVEEGGYILAGYEYLSDLMGRNQLLLVRVDAACDTLWVKTYGGQQDDRGYWACVTSDGGFAATGYGNYSSESPKNLFLVRTDSEGDTLWTRSYGGDLDDFGQCIEQTKDGGFIISGRTESFGTYESTDVWLLKTDSLGDTLWTRTFGGDYGDGGNQLIITKDGGYAIAGIYDLTGSMVPTSGDVLLIKTDSAGNLQWQKTYGITGGGFIEMAYGLNQTSDGGYIVVGAKEGLGPTGRDLWLLKTDSLGDTIWTRTIGGFGSDDGRSVHETTDGGYIITGSTNSYGNEIQDFDLWLIKTDSLGYVSIEESPVTHLPDFEVVNSVIPVGGSVVLRYSNYPQGFRASIYDATGRKVSSIQSSSPSGSITWGTGQNAGVYIIREEGGTRAKVVLVK